MSGQWDRFKYNWHPDQPWLHDEFTQIDNEKSNSESDRWIIEVNHNSHKARRFINGCALKILINYEKPYSLVVRYSSSRYLLVLAVEHDLDIDQMGAVTTFRQGALSEEMYMVQPKHFNKPNKECDLKKPLYGLKQASKV